MFVFVFLISLFCETQLYQLSIGKLVESPLHSNPAATTTALIFGPATLQSEPTVGSEEGGANEELEEKNLSFGVETIEVSSDASPIGNGGFLPTRGSLMLDFVFLAMLLILPVLQLSIYQAKKRRFRLHRNMQIGTAIALLAAVVLFEIDMRFFTDWRKLAEPSALYSWCTGLLYFHLCFAIPTPFLWGWVIYGALRNLDSNFQGRYVTQHRVAGKLAAIMMYGTGLTGILFYVVAFVL